HDERRIPKSTRKNKKTGDRPQFSICQNNRSFKRKTGVCPRFWSVLQRLDLDAQGDLAHPVIVVLLEAEVGAVQVALGIGAAVLLAVEGMLDAFERVDLEGQ